MPNGAQYRPDVQARQDGREAYSDGGRGQTRAYRSYPQTGDRYFDDNDWVGSDLVQHYLLAGSAVALNRAQDVFDYLQTGWETNLPKPGGVRWVDASWNGDRGAASTAGFGKLAAHLYEVTGRRTQAYLDWARRAADWVGQLPASNGLYANAMRADGALDGNLWIYNQGVLVGMDVLLHRVTGTADYLTTARQLADATLTYFSNGFTDPYYSAAGAGIGAYSGRGIFNAIFFRNLLLLHAVQPAYVPPSGVSYLQRVQAYADAAWDDPAVRDPATGLFKLDGGPQRSLLDQAGMVQVYASLAWSANSFGKLA
jgi:predicted alpha-1,6-mannanase (GH76 family)